MKLIYQLQEPELDPFLADSPLIVWFTFPDGRRTVSMALVHLIEQFYFPN